MYITYTLTLYNVLLYIIWDIICRYILYLHLYLYIIIWTSSIDHIVIKVIPIYYCISAIYDMKSHGSRDIMNSMTMNFIKLME